MLIKFSSIPSAAVQLYSLQQDPAGKYFFSISFTLRLVLYQNCINSIHQLHVWAKLELATHVVRRDPASAKSFSAVYRHQQTFENPSQALFWSPHLAELIPRSKGINSPNHAFTLWSCFFWGVHSITKSFFDAEKERTETGQVLQRYFCQLRQQT